MPEMNFDLTESPTCPTGCNPNPTQGGDKALTDAHLLLTGLPHPEAGELWPAGFNVALAAYQNDGEGTEHIPWGKMAYSDCNGHVDLYTHWDTCHENMEDAGAEPWYPETTDTARHRHIDYAVDFAEKMAAYIAENTPVNHPRQTKGVEHQALLDIITTLTRSLAGASHMQGHLEGVEHEQWLIDNKYGRYTEPSSNV